MDKREQRKRYKAVRNGISAQERSGAQCAIAERAVSLPEFIKCDILFSYVSFGSEVSTLDIIKRAWDMGKRVAVPLVTEESNMCFMYISSAEELKEGSYGIPEPEYDREKLALPTESSLMLLPGLAFDMCFYRLGTAEAITTGTLHGTPMGYRQASALRHSLPLSRCRGTKTIYRRTL